MRSIYPTEAQEGKALKQWADLHPIAKHYLFHIPNENKCSWYTGKSLKDQGKRAGVSDYCMPYPTKNHHCLFIELKRAKKSLSRLTKEQDEWLVKMNAIGNLGVIAYGWEDAAEKIKQYLG